MGAPAALTAAPVAVATAARAQALKPPSEQERITKAAQEFEGMLLEQLMQGMRKTVEPSGLFGQQDQSRSTFEYLMDQAVIAKAVKAGKGLGLAPQMERLWASRKGNPPAPENFHPLGNERALPIGIGSR